MVSLLIKRYLWLVNILDRYPQGLTLNEINGHWKKSSLYKDCGGREISRRTLYNHCNAILEQFAILIKVRQAGKYSKYILSSETSDEDYEEIRKWMLNSFATENLLSDCRSIHDKILLEAADTGANHLECIKEALMQNRLLAVGYQSFHLHSPEQKDMVIAPLALKMFRKRWYLLCHNIKKAQNGYMRLTESDDANFCLKLSPIRRISAPRIILLITMVCQLMVMWTKRQRC